MNSQEINNKNISYNYNNINEGFHKANSGTINYNNNNHKEYHKANSNNIINNNDHKHKLVSFYGQNMLPNDPPPNTNSIPQFTKDEGKFMSPIGIPQQQIINPHFFVRMPYSYPTNYSSQDNVRSKSDKNLNYNIK